DIALNPTGNDHVVSVGADGWFRLWDIRQGEEVAHTNGQSNGIRACAFTPDGKAVLGASLGNNFLVWDGMTDIPPQSLGGHLFGLTACAISPDGSLAITASDDKTIRVWDMHDEHDRHLKFTLGIAADIIRSCAVSADGTFCASGTAGGWIE